MSVGFTQFYFINNMFLGIKGLKYSFLIILLSLALNLFAEGPVTCINRNHAFQPGEKVEYQVYYNWGPIWVSAGLVTFSVFEKHYKNSQIYHFYSYGQTHRRYDWIFKVRDRFESYVDKESFRPLWYEMDTYEGGFIAKDIYNYDLKKNLVYAETEDSERAFRRDTIQITPCSFDVVTAVYVARNLNYRLLLPNENIPFSILIRNELMVLNPKYLGKELITLRDGRKYNCIKLSVELVEGFIFTSGNEMFIWVTDDDNRIPVLVEAQIRVGSVKAILKSAIGLRHPLKSLHSK